MIVVDTSVIVAIFENENDGSEFADIIASEPFLIMSAVNAHEAAVVLHSRRGRGIADELWRFLQLSRIDIAPFDFEQANAAFKAYATFGRGSGSKARLNLADCAAYALAKTRSKPLLFKGDDFTHTDIEVYRR